MAGRPRRYVVLFPTGETYTVHGQGGTFVRQRLGRAFGLTAQSDAEAIAKANTQLARFLKTPRRWDAARWRFVASDPA